MRRSIWVYILASQMRGTLYIGVTNDVARRLFEHRNSDARTVVGRYRVFRLVYVEEFRTAMEAIQREKSLKKRPRKWKIDLSSAIIRRDPIWRGGHCHGSRRCALGRHGVDGRVKPGHDGGEGAFA